MSATAGGMNGSPFCFSESPLLFDCKKCCSYKVVPALIALGSIHEAEGEPLQAMALYQKALAINEKTRGPFSPEVAANLHCLGRASLHAGKTVDAQQHYKRSLAILLQQPGLAASNELRSVVHDYADLMRKQDTSNSDLVSEFQREFVATSAEGGTVAGNAGNGSAAASDAPAR